MFQVSQNMHFLVTHVYVCNGLRVKMFQMLQVLKMFIISHNLDNSCKQIRRGIYFSFTTMVLLI